LDKATLVVARSISDASGEVIVKGTKTHQTRRIALDPSKVEVLRRQRARSEERAQMAGELLGPASYVWSQDLDGSTPYRPDRVTAAFVGLRNRLGLRHLTFHFLDVADREAATALGQVVAALAPRPAIERSAMEDVGGRLPDDNL